MTAADQHQVEVERGERFEFGKNWAQFLLLLDDERIKLAENSLRDMLGADAFAGKTFLDIGSGSGLFSLAARRMGAIVHSFDYDPHSYACTRELRRRYCPDDPNWVIDQASVLDRDYLATLGTFDIVYSWGVLHHTGQMYDALDNVKPLVKMDGRLFIAIYNDLGDVTDRWAEIKKTYNGLPKPLNTAYLLWLLSKQQKTYFFQSIKNGRLRAWIRSWTSYQTGQNVSLRGMSRWRDEVDWFGGYPYERASIEAIVDVYARDGFHLDRIVDRSLGYGCNEFVLTRTAEAGTYVDSPIPGGLSYSRQYGRSVRGPFEMRDGAWFGRPTRIPEVPGGAELVLFRDGRMMGAVAVEPDGLVKIASADETESAVSGSRFHIVSTVVRDPPEWPFPKEEGQFCWIWEAHDLVPFSDCNPENRPTSPVYIFEDGQQLPWPHALHGEIRTIGRGRFSHWKTRILFSTIDGRDPNEHKSDFKMLISTEAIVAPTKPGPRW